MRGTRHCAPKHLRNLSKRRERTDVRDFVSKELRTEADEDNTFLRKWVNLNKFHLKGEICVFVTCASNTF